MMHEKVGTSEMQTTTEVCNRTAAKDMNASNTPLPTCIDGISGADNIAQMWRDHYSDIFNSVNQTIDVVYNVDESTDFGDVVVPCPIALASIVSKVLEKILLNRLYIFLDTCSNQFGFKKKHSTDQCVFVLKELIDSYIVC